MQLHGTDSGRSILHITADYPDAFVEGKTPAIRNLIGLVQDRFDHRVISLNRATPSVGQWPRVLAGSRSVIARQHVQGPVTSLQYDGMPYGLFHLTMLNRLGDALYDRVAQGPRPDLIIGHKLTVEGILAADLAGRLGVPYAVTIQGNTDTRIVEARPDLAYAFEKILGGATTIFSFAPWAIARIEARLRIRVENVVHLPCPVALDTPMAPVARGGSLMTAFHFRAMHTKNFPRLAKAVAMARRVERSIRLEVFGGGTVQETARIARIAERTDGIELAGHCANAELPTHFNRAAGFVLPSMRESFGMVFVEALFCGCPIVYPAGRAVDGWFDRLPFAISVDPASSDAIADALLHLHRDEAALKTALAGWLQTPAAARFRLRGIAQTFLDALQTAAAPRGAALAAGRA